MLKLRRLLSLALALSICLPALCVGALADDDIDSGIMPTGMFVDQTSLIYWPAMSWSTPNDSGTFTSGSATINGLKSNQNSYVFSDRWLTSTDVGQIVNLDIGTVVVRDPHWYDDVVSISGYFSFGAQMMESGATPMNGTSAWVGPSRYEYVVSTASGGITGSGSGSRIKFDINFDEPVTIRGITINFYFGVKSFDTSNFSTANSGLRGAYLWWQSRSSARFTQDGADAQYKDDLLSGINEGNQLQAQTNGLLNTVISGVNNVITSITELPGKIADAIKGLFVPTQAQMEELQASFNGLLEDKLGFVYQAGSFIDAIFSALLDAVDNPNYTTAYEIPPFPSFEVNGTEVSLWDDTLEVDFSSNAFVQTAQTVAYPFVLGILVFSFVHSMHDAFLEFVGGASLADWVCSRRKGGET